MKNYNEALGKWDGKDSPRKSQTYVIVDTFDSDDIIVEGTEEECKEYWFEALKSGELDFLNSIYEYYSKEEWEEVDKEDDEDDEDDEYECETPGCAGTTTSEDDPLCSACAEREAASIRIAAAALAHP